MAQSKTSRVSKATFATLEPRVRNVSSTTIKKRWKKLHPNAQDKVKQMLSELKQRSRSSKRKGLELSELDNCVEDVAERLMLRLPRMPFPPSTDEQHFDFEATLTRIQFLEEQLISNVHAMNLLRTQIAREDRLLAINKQELDQLKQAMKSSEALRKKQSKNLHPLATKTKPEEDRIDNILISGDSNDENLTESKASTFSVLEGDNALNPLLSQLRSHLESMHNNAASMKPVEQSLKDAQGALESFTCRALDRNQYNAVHGIEID